MNTMNSKVDFYFAKSEKWQKELKKLRTIALSCELTEDFRKATLF
jgi:uncharacterized protein YdeI (YjbR/CyaY-like superfamily)